MNGSPTSRELATVLAALRFWQGLTDMPIRIKDEIATDNDRHVPLNDLEIDALCEKINTTL